MEGPTSKKTKESRKRANHNGNHQVPETPPLVVRSISNKGKGGL
jgi:hypothetical protein